MTVTETLLFIAGLLHFAILLASGLVPRVLDWQGELGKLPELLRQVIWVHGAYIVLMIIAIGAASVWLPGELASGSVLARSVCGFIAVFWGGRLAVQLLYLRPGQYLSNRTLWLGYNSLTVLFAFFAAVYGASAAGLAG